jgi:hypothetical protein
MYKGAISLFSTLVSRGAKSSTDGLVVPRGRSKYVKGRVPTWQLFALKFDPMKKR